MKKLSYEEFKDRTIALNRARRIFHNLTDSNLTASFEAYQEILAETEREINIDHHRMSGFRGSIFDGFVRPKCDLCGSDMDIRNVMPNDEGVNTQLVCQSEECDNVLDSELTMEGWADILEKKA
ncbi:MAG: hypothetical protein WC455_16445 [Dehalococcoidia bacterium]